MTSGRVGEGSFSRSLQVCYSQVSTGLGTMAQFFVAIDLLRKFESASEI